MGHMSHYYRNPRWRPKLKTAAGNVVYISMYKHDKVDIYVCGNYYYYYYNYYYKFALKIEVPEHSNCRLVPYWREFLGVSGSRTWSDTPFANS